MAPFRPPACLALQALWTPLSIAAHCGHVEAVRALLEAGANKEAETEVGKYPQPNLPLA